MKNFFRKVAYGMGPNEDIPSGSAFLKFKKEYTYTYGDSWIIE